MASVKRGQPPKPAGERAGSWIQLRVRGEDKALFVKAAQRNGQNLTEWAIDAMMEKAKK